MARKIVIYGNPDKSALGFPMPGDLKKYLENDIFAKEFGRYRYTQGKDADVIILSRDGFAYGHFDIASKQRPTEDDRRKYPRVKYVYLVTKSTLYARPVAISPLGIGKIRFRKSLTESVFEEIQKRAGKSREFAEVSLPEELPHGKYPEGAVKRILVNAYERNLAAVAACKAHYGTRCQVCGLDLGDRYGDIGKGFIHVHHLKKLSEVGRLYEVDPLTDLRPVCPNCHAMLHRNPPLSIEQLKSRINNPAVG
jgi:HNH endonuclease